MKTSGERRQNPRVPLEIWVEELHADEVYFRRSANISVGGVYFDRALSHPVGTKVTLKFALPGDDDMLVAHALVVDSGERQGHLGMSAQFTQIENNGQARLQAYIEGVAARG